MATREKIRKEQFRVAGKIPKAKWKKARRAQTLFAIAWKSAFAL